VNARARAKAETERKKSEEQKENDRVEFERKTTELRAAVEVAQTAVDEQMKARAEELADPEDNLKKAAVISQSEAPEAVKLKALMEAQAAEEIIKRVHAKYEKQLDATTSEVAAAKSVLDRHMVVQGALVGVDAEGKSDKEAADSNDNNPRETPLPRLNPNWLLPRLADAGVFQPFVGTFSQHHDT
jgi:hypothetical protein